MSKNQKQILHKRFSKQNNVKSLVGRNPTSVSVKTPMASSLSRLLYHNKYVTRGAASSAGIVDVSKSTCVSVYMTSVLVG